MSSMECITCACMLQSRAQGLMKQVQDMYEQVEQTYVEYKTFDHLRQHEVGAIPKRLEVSLTASSGEKRHGNVQFQ